MRRHPACLVAFVLLAGCASAPATPHRVTVTGVLAFDRHGNPHLLECGTRRKVALGTMAQGQYLHLRRRVAEFTRRRNPYVTAEFSGYLDRSGRSMERPAVMALAPGHCTGAPDPYADREY